MRTLAALLLFAACVRAPATATATAPRPEPVASEPIATPIPDDPVEALRQLLPATTGNKPSDLWYALDRELHAMSPGPARDELLRRGLAAADTWPDEVRSAPLGWNEVWRTGRGPVGWPLVRSVRITSTAEARRLLEHGALAQVTTLGVRSDGFDDFCERADELLTLLGSSPQLARVHTLSLVLPACVAPAALEQLARFDLPALQRLGAAELARPARGGGPGPLPAPDPDPRARPHAQQDPRGRHPRARAQPAPRQAQGARPQGQHRRHRHRRRARRHARVDRPARARPVRQSHDPRRPHGPRS